MEKMNAITFANTGHVLGVVTRSSQPDTKVSAEEVAGDGFRLRSVDPTTHKNIILKISKDDILVESVDYDTRVLYQPHLFALEGGVLEQKPVGPSGPSVTLDGTQIKVKLSTPVSDHVDVWCQVSGGKLSESIVRKVTILGTASASTDTGSVPLDLDQSQTYQVAVFAPGYALSVLEK